MRKRDIVQVPKQSDVVVQPRLLVFNAQFKRGFYRLTAFEADIFTETLKKAKNDEFAELILGGAMRDAELSRFDAGAVTHAL